MTWLSNSKQSLEDITMLLLQAIWNYYLFSKISINKEVLQLIIKFRGISLIYTDTKMDLKN
jgi:hypothetical protein